MGSSWLGSLGRMSGCVPCIPDRSPDEPYERDANEAALGEAPDRSSFERQLSGLNSSLDEKLALLRDTRAEISRLGEQRTELRRLMEDGRSRSKALDAPIDEAVRSLEALQKTLHESELQLPYTRMDALDRRLAKVQTDYTHRTFNNAKEEQNYVAEIDKLKRNKRKLVSYLDVLEEKKVVDKKWRELKDEQKAANRFYHHKQFQLRNIKKQRFKLIERINGDNNLMEGLGRQVRELEVTRKHLIEGYNVERHKYRATHPRHRRRSRPQPQGPKFAHSFPRGALAKARRAEDDGSSEDEDLEPFHEQKEICRNLLNFLRSLLLQMEDLAPAVEAAAVPQTPPPPPPTFSSVVSSREEGGLRRLESKTSEELLEPPPASSKSKRSSRKKKGNQSISMDGHIYNAFQRVEIDIPGTYADVPAITTAVETRLAWFEEQTSLRPFLLEWTDEDGLFFTAASSESERTTDSAWGSYSFSDAGSLSQLSFRSAPDDGAASRATSLTAPPTPEEAAALSTHLPPMAADDATCLRRALNASPAADHLTRSQSAGDSIAALARDATLTTQSAVGEPVEPLCERLGRTLELSGAAKASDEGIAACSKDSSTNSASAAHDVVALRKSLSDEGNESITRL